MLFSALRCTGSNATRVIGGIEALLLSIDQLITTMLRRLVSLLLQESHGMPVRQLLFNLVDLSCGNLFATVGGDQATVYDDMHMGDYIAVVLNFVNKRTPHAAGGVRFIICLPLSGACSCKIQMMLDSSSRVLHLNSP